MYGRTVCKDGGWRARPYEVAVGGAQSAVSGGTDIRPLQLIVQFVKRDPSIRPILPDEVLPIWDGKG